MKKYIAIFLILSLLMAVQLNTYAEELNKYPMTMPAIYNNITYLPLIYKYAVDGFISNLSLNEIEEFKDDGQDSYINSDNPIFEEVLKEKLSINGYYAIKSYQQFKELEDNNKLQYFDSITFGWAQMNYDEKEDKVFISIENNSNNDFYVPDGYEEVLEIVKERNIKTYINIYSDKNYGEIFKESQRIIDEIKELVSGGNREYRELNFDGIIIDFENLPTEYKNNYTEFLKELKTELNKLNRELIIAVQPLNSYDYGEIIGIVDKAILMLHDYDGKDKDKVIFTENEIYNPNAPIERIKEDLIKILNEINGDEDISKLWLQINFATNQWKIKEGEIMNQTPFKPTYDMLIDRINSELAKGIMLDDMLKYDEKYESPYLIYTDNDITNTIWYEDSRSVREKISLVKEVGLGGISLWRIGNIPNNSKDFHLDILDTIINFK